MAPILKKVFRLNAKTDPRYEQLCHNTAELLVSKQQMLEAQERHIQATQRRLSLIGNVLLTECSYVLRPADAVRFFDQTGEIKVFDASSLVTGADPHETEV